MLKSVAIRLIFKTLWQALKIVAPSSVKMHIFVVLYVTPPLSLFSFLLSNTVMA
jgi:hypothetical protein